MPRAPWLLLLIASALRTLVALRTDLPGRDGVSYLWMARQTANGHPEDLFALVFHPLYPAIVAAVHLCGVELELAGRLVATTCSVLAVLPLWFVTRALFGERAAFWGTLGFALGTWPSRHPAECMTEGPFHLAFASWALCLVAPRQRPAIAGFAAGAAYLLRPEGMALLALGPLWSWWRGERRAAAWQLLAGASLACLLPLGFLWTTGTLTLTPKATFNYEVGIGAAESGFAHYAFQAARLPLAAFEELGWLWFPLVLAGVWLARPYALRSPLLLLVVPFLMQCAVVPMLHAHWRFLSGFGVLLYAFAGRALPPLLDALRLRAVWLPSAAIVLLVVSEFRVLQRRNEDHLGERALGRWLGERLRPGEFLVSDMPRLDWFAGLRPPEPRRMVPERVRTLAASPECRFIALVRRQADGDVRARTAIDDAQLAQLGFTRVAPAEHAAASTQVAVFERR